MNSAVWLSGGRGRPVTALTTHLYDLVTLGFGTWLPGLIVAAGPATVAPRLLSRLADGPDADRPCNRGLSPGRAVAEPPGAPHPHQGKRALRRGFSAVLRGMTAPALTRAQQEIGRRLLALPEVLGADVVAAYAAMAGEVSLDEPLDRLCTMNKLLLLPRFAAARHEYEMAVVGTLGADTVPGSFGIREPRPDAAVATDSQWNGSATVWLIPGLAFDRFGTRLGRGGGFYDRLLARTQGPRIGIALEAQLSADPLPRETHDLPVHMIVTERRVLRVT